MKGDGLRSAPLRRYLDHQDVRLGLGIFLTVIAMGILVPAFVPYVPSDTGQGVPFTAPSREHPFGTDNFGFDVFSRTFAAARLDIGLSLAGVATPLVVGTLIGSALGLTRSRIINTIGSVSIEAVNAFPFIVVAAAILAITGPGIPGVLLALAVTNWARYARISRARAIVVGQSDYIAAGRVLGYSRTALIVRHVLPNVVDVSIAYGLSDLVIVILATAGLSFLGLGVQPPTPEWGSMMADGRLYLRRAWWIALFPGLVLSITAVALNFLGEGVQAVRRNG